MVARAAGMPVVSEIEIALDALPDAKIIAITGTNGKTTTTALVAHLLTALGWDAVAAGNIGTPLAEFAQRPKPPEWFALEVSSFQLHDTPSLAPLVGVLTNLTPDHLDRYASVADYYADKAQLFANARRRRAGSGTRTVTWCGRWRRRPPGCTRRFPSCARTWRRGTIVADNRMMLLGAPLAGAGGAVADG